MCRRDACIGHFKVQQVVQVFKAQATHIAFVGGRKLGVKSHVGALWVVEELAVNAQLGLRPHFLQKQTLAPAVVRHNHVGHKAFGLHGQCSFKASLCANGFGFKVGHPGMHLGCTAALRGVVHQAHTLPSSGLGFLHGHGHHLVALLHQGRRQELELARKVLMNEENFHKWRQCTFRHALSKCPS